MDPGLRRGDGGRWPRNDNDAIIPSTTNTNHSHYPHALSRLMSHKTIVRTCEFVIASVCVAIQLQYAYIYWIATGAWHPRNDNDVFTLTLSCLLSHVS